MCMHKRTRTPCACINVHIHMHAGLMGTGSSSQDLSGCTLDFRATQKLSVIIVIFKADSSVIESKGFPVISCTVCDDVRKGEGVGKGGGGF